MIITVIVNPRSQNERIEKISEKEYKVYFNVAPKRGKANEKMIEILSQYLKVPKKNIEIRLGKTAKEKIIEITDR